MTPPPHSEGIYTFISLYMLSYVYATRTFTKIEKVVHYYANSNLGVSMISTTQNSRKVWIITPQKMYDPGFKALQNLSEMRGKWLEIICEETIPKD